MNRVAFFFMRARLALQLARLNPSYRDLYVRAAMRWRALAKQTRRVEAVS